MLLAIDVGNSNITLGLWDGNVWRRQWRLLTVPDKTTDEYGITLSALLREAALADRIENVVLASVVPPLTAVFTGVGVRFLNVTPLLVESTVNTGIRILTDNPEAVGADRIVNAAAAFHLHPGPSITIDMGTATKFDVVSGNGELLGGVIAPGLRLTADALASRAAKLSHVALQAPPATLGRNTTHAMQSGLVFGYVCLIEGIIRRLLDELPVSAAPVRILGTGGLIHLIASHTDIIDHVDPWLTLTGLQVIHDRVNKLGMVK